MFKPKQPEKEEPPPTMSPAVMKLLSKKSSSGSAKRPPLQTQTTDHRLVYLNPKERARRDLENRHGKNIVKMAQASADRLNSTLEAQLHKLGVSLGRSVTNVKSML